MFLQPARDDGDFPPIDDGREPQATGSAPLPTLSPAIVHEAFVLRDRFGGAAEAEVDRRIVLAMQDCRLDEVHHLWAVWLALKGDS